LFGGVTGDPAAGNGGMTVHDRLRTTPVGRVLDGYRGGTVFDVPPLADALTGLHRVLAARVDVIEIEVNPLIVRPAGLGAVVVDALAIVEAPSTSLPLITQRDTRADIVGPVRHLLPEEIK